MPTDTATDIGLSILDVVRHANRLRGLARRGGTASPRPARAGGRLARGLENAILVAAIGCIMLGTFMITYQITIMGTGR